MYVLVRLIKGFPKPLFYKINTALKDKKLVGKVIVVPLKNKKVPAVVLKKINVLPDSVKFEIKEVLDLKIFPNDLLYDDFIKKISKFYFVDPIIFYKRISSFLFKKENDFPNLATKQLLDDSKTNSLTEAQQDILDKIVKKIENKIYSPSLIHGVTGSGKTEIYKKLIIKTLKSNQTVLFLVPEVSLSIQFERLFKVQLPQDVVIIGFHSASSAKDKSLLWQRLLRGEPTLIIGVHLPVLLPIPNLGLIIVDEEHESGFQEKKHPKVNSKELSIWRAKEYNIPIVLGSATPCLNSLYNVKNRNWDFYQLKDRFSGSFPKIELVFLKEEKRRKEFWISNKLERAIRSNLEKKEQTIIYLNRRGYSFFVQCKKCGFIFECPNCSVSLTLHKGKEDFLTCHYCDYKKTFDKSCKQCGVKEKDLLKKGIGTQQVVKILQNLFPKAVIERADLDTTKKKKAWKNVLENFEKGEIDILVGTQTITKGYHFPRVTLVGILWADLNLHFPVFNAAETALQKIIQVAGRAGRQSDDSKVIVQAIHDHYIFDNLNEKDYLNFCSKELDFRKEFKYPPFGRLVQVELKNSNVDILDDEAEEFFNNLCKINELNNLNIKILGPSKPIVHKIQKVECRHIFLKADSFSGIYRLLTSLNLKFFDSTIYFLPS